METDPTRMCEVLVGLPDINVSGVGEWPLYLRIADMARHVRPVCHGCGRGVQRHGIDEVELVDLPCFGRRTRLVWRKQRWRCPKPKSEVVTFTEPDSRIAASAAAIRESGWAVGNIPSRVPWPQRR